jgi:hypothetical protein
MFMQILLPLPGPRVKRGSRRHAIVNGYERMMTGVDYFATRR